MLTAAVRALEAVSQTPSQVWALDFGNFTRCLRSAPWIGPWIGKCFPPSTLRDARVNVVVLVCLTYPDQVWEPGSPMTIECPKSDLKLMLGYLRYRHQEVDRQFVIITDFEPEPFEDADGVSMTVPFIRALRQTIEDNVRLILRGLSGSDKCLIYCMGFERDRKLLLTGSSDSGHIDLDPVTTAAAGPSPDACFIIGSNERIYDYDFRSWLNESRHQSTTIIVVLDACHSGEFLGLPYRHEDSGRHSGDAVTASNLPTPSQVIEISSSRKDQTSFGGLVRSESGQTAVHGFLTWHLIDYLREHPRPDLCRLASYLREHCNVLEAQESDGDGRKKGQTPLVSCSRIIKNRVLLL